MLKVEINRNHPKFQQWSHIVRYQIMEFKNIDIMSYNDLNIKYEVKKFDS